MDGSGITQSTNVDDRVCTAMQAVSGMVFRRVGENYVSVTAPLSQLNRLKRAVLLANQEDKTTDDIDPSDLTVAKRAEVAQEERFSDADTWLLRSSSKYGKLKIHVDLANQSAFIDMCDVKSEEFAALKAAHRRCVTLPSVADGASLGL